MMIHREVSGFYCRDCIQKAFWSNTVPTLFLGWWGMLSVFITPVVLVSNLLEFWRQKRLISQW